VGRAHRIGFDAFDVCRDRGKRAGHLKEVHFGRAEGQARDRRKLCYYTSGFLLAYELSIFVRSML
jgi:hypothetical protein